MHHFPLKLLNLKHVSFLYFFESLVAQFLLVLQIADLVLELIDEFFLGLDHQQQICTRIWLLVGRARAQ